MQFEVRQARVEDGGVDDNFGTFLATVDSSTGCMRAILAESKGAADYLAGSVTDFVKNLFVWSFRLRCDSETPIMAVTEKVKAKMTDRVVVKNTTRHNSASNGLTERAIRTFGEELRTLRYETKHRYKTRSIPGSTVWPWMVRLKWEA